MLKTTNYNLNKPEVTDPLRVADFNENADKIDAVLAAVAAGMSTCRMAYGSYNGAEKYGADFPVTLSFDFKPLLVVVSDDKYGTFPSNPMVLSFGQSVGLSVCGLQNDSASSVMTVSWETTGFPDTMPQRLFVRIMETITPIITWCWVWQSKTRPAGFPAGRELKLRF